MRDHRHFLITHLKLAYALQNFQLEAPSEHWQLFQMAARPDSELAESMRLAALELRYTDLGFLEALFVQLMADLIAVRPTVPSLQLVSSWSRVVLAPVHGHVQEAQG